MRFAMGIAIGRAIATGIAIGITIGIARGMLLNSREWQQTGGRRGFADIQVYMPVGAATMDACINSSYI